MMEIDSYGNENAEPRQNVTISNFTFNHRNAAASNAAAIRIRGGADYTFVNGLITSDTSCIRIDSTSTTQTTGADEQGPPKFFSVSLKCGSRPFRGGGSPAVSDAAVQAIFGLDRKSTRLTSSH